MAQRTGPRIHCPVVSTAVCVTAEMACGLLRCSNCEKARLIEALRSKRVRDIACGSSHSAAIISNGDLFTWGLGDYGRLGHGDNATQLRPKQVGLSVLLLHINHSSKFTFVSLPYAVFLGLCIFSHIFLLYESRCNWL